MMQPPSSFHLPLDWYRQMRDEHPVSYDERRRSWYVFRYDEAFTVLSDPVTFSSAVPGNPSILGMDPPRQRQLRGIVAQVFTPRMIAQLEPRVHAVTNALLDQALARGEMEVIADLAYPLPISIISTLLGIPQEEQDTFRQWADVLVKGTSGSFRRTPEEEQYYQHNQQALDAYFLAKIEERRRQPGSDLISRLISAEVDGEHLSEPELLDFCSLLLIAGYETTANLIGNAVVCLDERPDVQEALRRDPSLIPDAIEEILRCYPSVVGALRIAHAPARIAEQYIEAGQHVVVWAASANYDERHFPHAERFDIKRTPNRHLTFGYGIHFCLGASLARLESTIALTTLLERLPLLKRLPGENLEMVESPFILGVKAFPITWKKKTISSPLIKVSLPRFRRVSRGLR